jgi:hypothetical protein
MAQEFRGAPTRIGRIILAAFGAPFVLTAAALLGAAIFGGDEPGEKFAMVMAATVFAGCGLFLWAPAFPGVVNRILRSENRLLKAIRPHAPPLAVGGMIILMGMVPVLAAVGVIPTDDSFWQAPRWVGGLAGGLFVVAGVFLLTRPAVENLPPPVRKQVEGLFPLLIVTIMAAISGWVAFGPGERHFESSATNGLLGFAWGGHEILGRLVFGVGAVFLIVITAIGWWKYLTGRW